MTTKFQDLPNELLLQIVEGITIVDLHELSSARREWAWLRQVSTTTKIKRQEWTEILEKRREALHFYENIGIVLLPVIACCKGEKYIHLEYNFSCTDVIMQLNGS